MKHVPVYHRDTLVKKTKGDIKFVKQVPLSIHERLKRKSKLDNYSNLNKRSKNDFTFIKQVPLHARERLKRLEKIKEKVHSIKEVANAKPNILAKTTKNTDKNEKYK